MKGQKEAVIAEVLNLIPGFVQFKAHFNSN
jgi:hypothetical protein